ncbi:LexA repressor [Methylorubrum aminovorans]
MSLFRVDELPDQGFSTVRVPLMGPSLCAGFPSPADDFVYNALELPRWLVPNPPATFLWRIAGYSMRDAGIFDGALACVDRSLKLGNGSVGQLAPAAIRELSVALNNGTAFGEDAFGGVLNSLSSLRMTVSGKALRDANLGDLARLEAALENLGLNQIDNTSDADKPVCKAQGELIDRKLDATSTALLHLLDVLPLLPSDPTAYPATGGLFRDGDANGYRLIRIYPSV